MEIKRVQKSIEWTAEDRARHKAIRENFAHKPTMEELVASGDYVGPVPHGVYLRLKVMLHELKKTRESTGLSLADVAERSGIDKAALSRLENGHQDNPTLETILRYLAAIGKDVEWRFVDAVSAH